MADKFKKRVRKRMIETGESYSIARMRLSEEDGRIREDRNRLAKLLGSFDWDGVVAKLMRPKEGPN